MSGSNLETQKATIQAFIAAEEAWDIPANVELRTPDCRYQLLPLSMGHPERTNDEFAKFYSEFAPIWKNYKIDVVKILHDQEQHRSSIHIMDSADCPIGPFKVETFFMLQLTDDCRKISRVEEYVDSKYFIDEFISELQALNKNA